ncbi:hypothetical protein E1193_01080 [Micromonospora sp. KC606]|nr:hypothetical protein E1193_01080 [Micromonospora sp. KC606]
MRAKDICHALGTGTIARDTEGLRAKLKRLVGRQILAETEPGLFVLAPADVTHVAPASSTSNPSLLKQAGGLATVSDVRPCRGGGGCLR